MFEKTLTDVTKSLELIQLRRLVSSQKEDYEWKLQRAEDAKTTLEALKSSLYRREKESEQS